MNKQIETRGLAYGDLDTLDAGLRPTPGPRPTVVTTMELGAHLFQFRAELRPLLNKLRNALARGVGTVLHLTSPVPGEGVSTLARELACAAAAIAHCRPLLLDFNQGQGDQSATFGGPLPGVVSAYMARGSVEVAAVSACGGLFHAASFDVGSFDSFTFPIRYDDAKYGDAMYGGVMSDGAEVAAGAQAPRLSSGDAPPRERPRTLADLYDSLCGAYNLIVVDCPPVVETPYFVPLSHDMPDVILVVRAERTRIPVVMRAKEEIPALGGRLVGLVMNECRPYVPKFIDRLL